MRYGNQELIFLLCQNFKESLSLSIINFAFPLSYFIFCCFSKDPYLISSTLQHLISAQSVEAKYLDYKITVENHFLRYFYLL